MEKLVIDHAVGRIDRFKNNSKKTNAEDNTDALLAEALYIINNVDEFLVEEEVDALV